MKDDRKHEQSPVQLAGWIFAITLAGVAAYAGVVFAWILF